jgi:hypothetical protein
VIVPCRLTRVQSSTLLNDVVIEFVYLHERVIFTVVGAEVATPNCALCLYRLLQYNTARYDPAAPINSAIAGAVSDTTATASTAGKKGADKGNAAKDTKAISPLKVHHYKFRVLCSTCSLWYMLSALT